MRIQPIVNCSGQLCPLSIKTKTQYRNPMAGENPSDETNFKGWAISGDAILGMRSCELKDLAESFHRSPNDTLLNISIVRNIFGFKKTKDSMMAYEKLKSAIDKIKNERSLLMFSCSKSAKNRLSELDKKASRCVEDYYEEPDGYNPDDPVDYASTHWP